MALQKSELFSRSAQGLFTVVKNPTSSIGNIWWVDSTHANATDSLLHGTSPDSPCATIDYAVGLATASTGDIIYVNPFHAETITSSITMDKIGLSIIGLGRGESMPIVTPNGAIDAVTMTAAGSSISRIRFGVPGTTAQTADINVGAAYCSIIDTRHLVSTGTEEKTDTITLTADADDCEIRGVRIYQTAVTSLGSGIILEGALTNLKIDDVYMFCTGGFGYTKGALADEATATGVVITNSVFMNDKADTVCVEMGNNCKGFMSHCGINGRHTTLASNMSISTGMAYHQTFTVEEGGLSGYVNPVVDAE